MFLLFFKKVFRFLFSDINKNKIIKEFSNINIYQVMCKLLDITPSNHDGKWEAVDGLLVSAHAVLSSSGVNSNQADPPSEANSLTASLITNLITIACFLFL